MLQVQQLHGFGVLGEGTGNDQLTKVLLHFDGSDASTTFTDSNKGGTVKTFTAVGNAQIDTAQSVFGGASGLFDGSGDSVTSPDHADFEVSGDYTLECRIRANSLTASHCVFSKCRGAPVDANRYYAPYACEWESTDNTLVYYSSSTGTSWDIANRKTFGAISTATWYHIAAVRSGNNYYLFKNGIQTDAWTNSSAPINNAGLFRFGILFDANFWDGWIEEFRKSDYARWTSQFTPPQSAYS